MSKPRLKPCPFCGGEPRLHDRTDGAGFRHAWVQCHGRYCPTQPYTRDVYDTATKAIAAWNRRAKEKGK